MKKINLPVTQINVEVPPDIIFDSNGAAAKWGATVTGRLGAGKIWHVNTTATGGGVAELLRSSIGRHHMLDIPANWLVVDAEPKFFRLTKRIHHGIHGRHGEGHFIPTDHELYRAVTSRMAEQLLKLIRPGDVVVLHDPQTLGAAIHLLAAGVKVTWRCHIGTCSDGPTAAQTWDLLRPYVEEVPRCIFSMTEYAPSFLPPSHVITVLPSIDPYTAKSREIPQSRQADLLASIGLTEPTTDGTPLTTPDGGRLGRTVQDVFLPPNTPVIVQVSRWDPLKDMLGVLNAFADHIASNSDAHLLLAGPDPADIPDDPEGERIYAEVRRRREILLESVRRRVHLVMLSLRDFNLNGLVVNAVQRRATVVAQKSLEEGFGLTVAEAMWKARPIIASRVGGLTTQVVDEVTGLLVEPTDLASFGNGVNRVLHNPEYAARLGAAGRQRCAEHFLAERELIDYLRIYQAMLDD